MTIKAKTTRTENDLVSFANANNIPLASLDHTVNSSGMFTTFHADADVDHGKVVYGVDDATGAAPGVTNLTTAIASASYTDRINVANTTSVTIWLTVVTANNSKLDIYVRESRLGAPNTGTSAHWYLPRFESDPTGSGTVTLEEHKTEVKSADMNVAGGKYVFSVDTNHANWISLVFVGNAAHRITVIAEVSH
jgi:hypothetical protein